MSQESTEEGRGLFVCRKCGHRAEVAIDTSAEVFVDEGSRQGALTSLGLVRCPACGRRDTRIVLVEALLPTLGGVVIALVIPFFLVVVGMLAIAGPDPRENEARFPYLVAVAAFAGLVTGGGFVAWQLGRALRRAARNVSFGRTAVPGEAPYRAPPDLPALGRPSFGVSQEQRTQGALGLVAASALAIGFLGLGSATAGRIACGVATAVVAGAIRGNDAAERAVFSVAFMVAEAGIIVATVVYTSGRSSVWNVELLVPLVLGALPGAVVYYLAAKRLGRREPYSK